jgi:DNA invertase Pin-like site-specific DNA recombinase
MRAAIYLRVSTKEQTTENQRRELQAVAERRGFEVVEVYEDHGISGSKGRDKRPAFDKLHKDASRRHFDVVMAWSVDRLGRSLQDLVAFMEHTKACKVDMYLHQQGLDTTTPAGRMMYGMLSVFSAFEREMIVERVVSGMARAKAQGTKSGKPIGRAPMSEALKAAIRAEHAANGGSLRTLGKQFGVSHEIVRRCIA